MINKSVNTFTNGLNTNEVKNLQPKDTYSYALNVVKDDSTNNPETISNEKGFETYFNLGYNYILLGSIYLGKKDYILFIKNLDSSNSLFNRIILLQDQISTIILDNINLNWDTNHPIKGTYRINYKNEKIIYFVDGKNDDRVLNIDNNTITDLDQLSIDIKYRPAILQSKSVNDSDGSLLTGTYEFFGSYKSVDNATTPWFLLTGQPIYIIDENINTSTQSDYLNIDGCDSGIITSKSINLNLINLDPNFSKLRIGILKTYNGVQSAVYIDDIFYTDSTINYVYSGFAPEVKLASISDLLVDQVRYYGSNAITQSDGRLLRANTKLAKINIDYQSYANNITTDYYIDEELVMTMADTTDYNGRSDWWKSAATKYSDKKSLMRDEIYSVGIAFGLIKEGIETEVYHIPGRALNNIPTGIYENQYNDSPTITNTGNWDSVTITENGETILKWKVVNTAAKNGFTTKPAYWESSEKYPDNFSFPISGSTSSGINNTNIRHHKMPSAALEPLYRRETIGGQFNFYKRNLGLKFNNITIPDELKGNVAYIRIYLTPRTSDKNKSIVGKGIFVNCSYTKTYPFGSPNPVSSSNYWVVPCQPYNDLDEALNNGKYYNEGIPGTDDTNTNNNYYHSFYSPDTLFKTPALSTDRVLIENEITGIVHYYNTIASFINVNPAKPGNHNDQSAAADGGYKRDLFYDDNNGALIPTRASATSSGDVYNVANTFKTTYRSISIFNTINKIHEAKSRRRLKTAVYVPFNAKLDTSQLGGMDNPYYSLFGPANVLVELNPSYNILGATETTDTSVNFTDNDAAFNHLQDRANDNKKVNGTFHFHTIPNPLAVYRYGSIKRDNASQYGTVTNLNYTPTDLVIANPIFDISGTLTNEVKGLIGDSFIDLLSVKRIRYAAKENYTYGNMPEVSVGISTFFTESNINHRLRYGDTTHSYYPKQVLTTPIQQYLNYGQNPTIVTQDNFYKENPDFDKLGSKENYGVNEDDLVTGELSYSTRIAYSEKLLDESKSDTYRTFLANNYKDLPKNTGSITHLFTKQQELYAITRDSLWRLFATNQTIKSSTDDITIGTGEFLSPEPVEPLSIEGGYAGSSSKFGLVQTPYGYFYCDRNKGRFILFDKQQKDISLKGVTNYLKDNFELEIIKQIKELDAEFDQPLLNYGYLVGFEPSNNRILLTKLDYKFTTESFSNYKGIYDPNTTYQVGDIYLKDGIFYEYGSTSQSYVTLYDTSNLSIFTPSTVNPIVFNHSAASNGTVTNSTTLANTLVYTPNTGYTGSDTFNITVGCHLENINVTVQDAPVIPNYTTSLVEHSANGTIVQDVDGVYTSALTYSIDSGNDLDIFTINPTTGVITVLDNTNLDYNVLQQANLVIRGTSGSLYGTGITTVNITKPIPVVTGTDQSVSIASTISIGTLIYTLSPATETNPVGSSILYSIISESDPGMFTTDLDTLQVTYTTGTLVPSSTHTITYRAQDNVDSSRFDDFTLTINVQALIPGVINYTVVEQEDPYADVNLEVKDNGTQIILIGISGSGSHGIPIGNTMLARTYCQFASTGVNPIMRMVVTKNSVTVYDQTTPAIIGAELTYSDTVTNGAVYNINITSSTDIVYQNVRKSQVFVRDNCSSGQTGTPVEYIVDAGTYTSTISQADADNQAQDDIDANGQIYADANGTCLTNATIATLFMDYYSDADADLCCYCDTNTTDEYQQIVWSGSKLYPNDGSDPSVCFLAASDRLSQTTPKRRFGMNLGKFIQKYPSINVFTFQIVGRSSSSITVGGVYNLKAADQGKLIMRQTGPSNDELIPSTDNPASTGLVSYTSHISGGGDGTVGVGVGSPVLTLTYTVSTNTVVATTY